MDLELRVKKEDVVDFFEKTVPDLLEPTRGHYNFYLDPQFNAQLTCSCHAQDKRFDYYQPELSELTESYNQEKETFLGIMRMIKQKLGVSEKIDKLFGLYCKISDAAKRLNKKFEDSKDKPDAIHDLLCQIQLYLNARNMMYNLATREEFLSTNFF